MKGIKRILRTELQVQARTFEMGGEIAVTYKDVNPLFLCLTKGGVPLTAQLMSSIAVHDPDFHPEVDYLRVSTYGNGREAGKPFVEMGDDLRARILGRHAILLDDVLDTGETTHAVTTQLMSLGASAVDLCVLVEKERPREHWEHATMAGFVLPDVWLSGMGCDDPSVAQEAYRWAGFIGEAE